ncbi:MAG: hypothetical protein ACRDSR_26085 [Pseudonocardiaceae bacterium]
MRRSSDPQERAQFSVAELLARYGEPAPTAGRRRRRAADDTDAVAQPPGAALADADRPSRHGAPPSTAVQSSSVQSSSAQPHRNGRWTPAVATPAVDTSVLAPAVPTSAGHAPAVGRTSVGPSSVIAGSRVPTATVLSDDRATVQFPRLQPAPPNPTPWPGRSARGGEPPAGLGTATGIPEHAIPEQKVNARQVDELAGREAAEEPGDVGTGEPDVPECGSPMREWASMVAQVGIGLVGGAALWLICEWLWQRLPVVALVVALAVITGLVWVVRRVRRAEDLQTTVIAVLVGLFVTVSPAALLLVGGR